MTSADRRVELEDLFYFSNMELLISGVGHKTATPFNPFWTKMLYIVESNIP
jgi:hypothetical protein